MFLRINKQLNDRRAGLKRDEGFTLIELLVVVLIIGILAAIAIPVFLGVQDNAKKAAVTSDLTNAKTAIIAYYTDKPSAAVPSLTLTDASATSLVKWGYTKSTNVTLTFKADPTGPGSNFCLIGSHAEITNAAGTKGGPIKWITAEGGVTDTAC